MVQGGKESVNSKGSQASLFWRSCVIPKVDWENKGLKVDKIKCIAWWVCYGQPGYPSFVGSRMFMCIYLSKPCKHIFGVRIPSACV